MTTEKPHYTTYGAPAPQTGADPKLLSLAQREALDFERSERLLAEQRAEAAERKLEEMREALISQTGCDCDSSLYDPGWSAPHHASDCSVYRRWAEVEARLRALTPPASTAAEETTDAR